MMAAVTALGQQAAQRGAGAAPRPPARVSRSAASAALVVLLLPVMAAIMLRRHWWMITSDSVAQQSIVRTWFALGHDQTYLPPDTWLLKFPVYGVVEALPIAPSARLIVESLALAVVTVALLAWACWSLAGQAGLADSRRPLDAVLPFAWLGTLAGGVGSYLVIMPNSRNIELGLGLVVIAVAGQWLERDPRPVSVPTRHDGRSGDAVHGGAWPRGAARWGVYGGGAALLLAVVWVDDPYVEALVGLPLALAALAWFARHRDHGGRDPRLLALAAVLLASLALVPLLRGALAAFGVRIVPDATAPTFDLATVLGHVPILGPSVQAQLGLSEEGAAAAVAHVLAVVLLLAGLVAAGAVTARGWRRGRLAVTFLGVHWLVVVVGVLVNRTIYDFHAGRYLVLAFVDLAACLALAPGLLRQQARMPPDVVMTFHRVAPTATARVTTALLVAAVAVDLVSAVHDTPPDSPQVHTEQVEQQRVLALLTTATGDAPAEAFGPFWTADLYTHLSSGRVQVSDVVCAAGRIRHRHWITDTARERPRAALALVIVPVSSPELRGCTVASISAQLGGASQQLRTAGGTTVLVFGHDVAALIPVAVDA